MREGWPQYIKNTWAFMLLNYIPEGISMDDYAKDGGPGAV